MKGFGRAVVLNSYKRVRKKIGFETKCGFEIDRKYNENHGVRGELWI